MAKPGDEYMELVGDVAKALDPGSSVRVGEWIDAPDGKRELDVEVRGTIDGSPHFILIECKDWRKRVGVEVIDALDSKRRDVHANQAIVYSNSGFTAQALRKATRVGIGAASALNAGDGKVRAVVQREIVAKRLSVDSMQSRLYEFPGESLDGLDGWNVGDLQFDESPVVNWISELSRRLIVENENATSIAFRCAFNRSTKWSYHGRPLSVAGIELVFSCSKKWLSQVVTVDVTLGLFDHLLRRVTVPNQHAYFGGWINQDAWSETHQTSEEAAELQPGTFEFYITLVNHIHPEPNTATPKLDELIAEHEVLIS